MKSIGHWINGSHVYADTQRSGDVFDPATGKPVGRVEFADEAVVRDATEAALGAFDGWRDKSLIRRAEAMFAFQQILSEGRNELAEIVTSEHGKVHADALGEIERGLEVIQFACGIPHLLKGAYSEQVATGVDTYSIAQPLGVVGVITPFNFPAMVPLWFFPIAIAAGNTVIVKPSEKNPSSMMWLVEKFKEAGFPDGVLNVVNGDKVAVDAILDEPRIKAVSFVGSTLVARAVYERGTRAGKRIQALGGAKNHMLVMPDANLGAAADAAVNAGYGSAGERCMAISVIVAVNSVADKLVEAIAERTLRLRTGASDRGCDMGPLISREHRDKVRRLIEEGLSEGATLVVDGRDTAEVEGDPEGFWLRPTLFDHVQPSMSIYREEVFGPVLSVVRVASQREAIDLINANPYGNGTAIFTRDGGTARQFQFDIEVGMVGINVPIPVPVSFYSFGGWKSSLFGDLHAYGSDGVRFFTRSKVVTARWSVDVTRGVNLKFPDAG